MKSSPLKPLCGECWYFQFIGFVKFCSHPDKARVLVGVPLRCKEFQDYSPVVFREFKERLTIDELKSLLRKDK